MSGFQVAVVAPTTLLVRQHVQTFRERFRGLPVEIGQLSRLVAGKDARRGAGAPCRRQARHRDRHPRAAGQVGPHEAPRPAGRGRGAAFRRRPQGAAEAIPQQCPCADADRDADPAHAPACALRRARDEPDRHPAGGPAGGAHLRCPLRRAGGPGGHPARIAAGRALLLCLPAGARPAGSDRAAAGDDAGGPHRRRPWRHGGVGAGGSGRRLL